ncbi:hypothetical protein ABQ333_16690 [Serratia fonticola]|uniref:hypothetical protein n=1 Tax=Serratia fonticola TaxID=47917 RepID=UPI003AAC2A71|nr:hypothetical protein [Serratia fonticola]HBE9091384.1 hypothetical protein [Serratia fonticola]
MRNLGSLDLIDALNKIQALASAAGYLTASEREKQLCLELLDVIEDIARRGSEVENG